MFSPPPLGVNSFLTTRESNGASVARLPAVTQDSSSTSSSVALFSLTDTAKRFSPAWLHAGIIHKEEEEQTEIMGGVRQWVMDGTLHPIKGFLLDVLCKQRDFFWSVIY